MAHPDPEHVIFLSKWAQEIIATLIFILLVVLKFIGSKLGGKNVNTVTQAQLIQCSSDVGDKIDRLEGIMKEWIKEYRSDITHVHKRIDNHLDNQ